tara:strand:+ start:35 stop:595 length:561 start_codon:yes stop_codon:yes gene_type:complete
VREFQRNIKKIKTSRGFGNFIMNRVRTIGVVGSLVLVSSCSSFTYEKGGTMLGTGLGVGTGKYMCDSSGFGPKFGIGCMVLGGLMGGVLGGMMGESFDNKEIYHTVQNHSTGGVETFIDGDKQMKVEVTDDYIVPEEPGFFNSGHNRWCKDFQFELHEDGQFKRGKGTSCLDNEGNWRTMGIDLIR